ncbi:MAG TPA: tetratricopeptide repeat protein, partial [Sumerlaeia bacterium]|nr:tetratricopeptide repeat protein [Sumerlaeia bacterium]
RYRGMLEAGDLPRLLERLTRERPEGRAASLEALALRSFEADLRIQMAKSFLDRKDPVRALETLEEAEHLSADCPEMEEQICDVLLAMESYSKAATSLESALREDPENHKMRTQLLVALVESGRVDEAVSHRKNGPEGYTPSGPWTNQNGPAVGQAFRSMGFRQLERGSPQEARDVYDAGFEMSVRSAGLYEEAIKFYTRVGDNQTASRMFALLRQMEASARAAADWERARRATNREDVARAQAANARRHLEKQLELKEKARSRASRGTSGPGCAPSAPT